MYSLRSQVSVTPGRLADYEARNAQFLELLRAQPGYQGGALLNSLSYPAQYNLISNWENRQAAFTFARSQAFQTFIRQHPNDNIFTGLAPIEAYEIVLVQREGGQPTYATLIERTIRQDSVEAFLQSRRQLIELRHKQARGVVTSAISRLAGSQTQWVGYLSWLSQSDAEAFRNSAPMQQWISQHGTTYDSAPPVINACEVVMAHVPAPV
jgi:quinol monooxygenase YgiN